MRRPYAIITLCALFVAVGAVIILFLFVSPEEDDTESTFSGIPDRLTRIGPFSKGFTMTEEIGPYDITLKARQMHMKKSRVLGFDSALYKRLALDDLHVTVWKEGKRVLEFRKDRTSLPPTLKTMEIDHPEILYPGTLKGITKIRLNKDKKYLKIYKGSKVETWALSQ